MYHRRVATIIKRGSAYRAIIRRRGHPTLTKTFKRHALAAKWVRETEYLIELKRLPSREDVGSLLSKYRDEVLEPRGAGQSTLAHYARLARTFTGVSLNDLTPEWWLAWASGLSCKPASKERYFTMVCTALTAAETLWRSAVPWRDIRRAKRLLRKMAVMSNGRPRDRRVKPGEVEAIKATIAPSMSIPLADIIDFAMLTALRQGEIARIEWADVDEPTRTVLVRDRKHPTHKVGNHGRVPMLGNAWDILQRQPKAGPRVFPWKAASIGDAFDRTRDRAGVKGLRFHDLRHEATSRLFELGYGVAEVSLVTGHRDWASLRRYTHLRPEDLHAGPVAKRGPDESRAKE